MATNSVQRLDVIDLVDGIAGGMIAALDACTVIDAGLDLYRAAVLDYRNALHKALGADDDVDFGKYGLDCSRLERGG